LELVDHDVLEPGRLADALVLAEEDEREQLKEAEAEVVAAQREPEVPVVDVVDERLELRPVLAEHFVRHLVVEPLRPPAAPDLGLRRRVREVRLVAAEAAQVLAQLRLFPAVVPGAVHRVEPLSERREVTVEVGLAVPVPAVGRREDSLRRELVDQVEQLARRRERAVEVGVFRVLIAEAAEELAEPLGLDQLVFEDPRRARYPLVDAEVRRRVVPVFLKDLVTVRVERPDGGVGELTQSVLAVVDDPLFHLRRGAPRERRQQHVVRFHVRSVDDPPVAAGDGERLARSGAGVDEVRPLRPLDELPLRVVRRRLAHRSPSNSRSRWSTRR
jgi:hypothetical protein